jgi:hypothetical protein
MKPLHRAIAGLLVQVALVGLGAYVVLSPDALPGSTLVARCAIGVLFLVVGMLLAEVSRLRTHFGALIAALQAGVSGGTKRDDRAAVDVLVRALSSDDADVRIKAHRNLVRITGQKLTMDPAAWQAWWAGARETFQGAAASKGGSGSQ